MPMIIFASGCDSKDPVTPEPDPKPVEPVDLGPCDVVVISGQSNAVGCTQSIMIKRNLGKAEKYEEYMAGFPGIQIAYDCWTKEVNGDGSVEFKWQNRHKTYNFVKVMLGQGNNEANFGPEIGIAEAMNEKYSGKLFIIKYACGASNLKDDFAQKTSPMYPKLIKFVKLQMQNLKDKGYQPTIKAFCWMQGEGDAWANYYDKYLDNTRAFVSHIREDLRELAGNKDLPFIDAGINDNREVWTYGPEVNEAKKQFAEESENNIYIDTVAAGMHTDQEPIGSIDRMHYDSESEIQLGHLFAENFEQFLDKGE